MRQTSRGKFNRLQRTTAESKTSTLDEYGLRCHQPARPPPYASYPVLVHRLASLLHPSFKPHLTMTPLRFAITSPPSGRVEDLHLQAVKHARHTENSPGRQFWVMASNPKTVPNGTAEERTPWRNRIPREDLPAFFQVCSTRRCVLFARRLRRLADKVCGFVLAASALVLGNLRIGA